MSFSFPLRSYVHTLIRPQNQDRIKQKNGLIPALAAGVTRALRAYARPASDSESEEDEKIAQERFDRETLLINPSS
jgi:hypothetical protein